MRFKNKRILASLATGTLAVVMMAAGASSASANTEGTCVYNFYSSTTDTFINGVSCTGGRTLAAVIYYYASDNTTHVTAGIGRRVSTGSSFKERPAGSFLYGHGVSYQ